LNIYRLVCFSCRFPVYSLLCLHIHTSYLCDASKPLNIQEAIEQRVVKKQNCGTNFRFLQTIYVVTDSYTHHLVLDLPVRNVSAFTSRLVPASHPKELNKRFEEWTSNISPAGVLATGMGPEILYLQASTDIIYELFTEIDPSALGNRKRRFSV
jgi:hypothetical protein